MLLKFRFLVFVLFIGNLISGQCLFTAPYTAVFDTINFNPSDPWKVGNNNPFGPFTVVDTCWIFDDNGAKNYFYITDLGKLPLSRKSGPPLLHGMAIVAKTSNNGNQQLPAYFQSPFVDKSTVVNPQVSFAYHMYGANIVKLILQYQGYGSSTWLNLDSLVGEQHIGFEPYKIRTLNLNGLPDTLSFRFAHYTSNGFDVHTALSFFKIAEKPNCSIPLPISNISFSGTSVQIKFANTTNALHQFKLVRVGLAVNRIGISVFTNSDSVMFQNLNQGESYYVHQRVICGSDTSKWQGAEIISVPCGFTRTFPFTENFDSWTADTVKYLNKYWPLNSCWENVSQNSRNVGNEAYWFTTNGGKQTGSPYPKLDYSTQGNFLSFSSGGAQIVTTNSALISPSIDLTPSVNPELKFYYHGHSGSNTLYISVLNSTGWQLLDSLKGPFQSSNTDAWLPYVYDISQFKGTTIQIKFELKNATNPISIDDFSIREKPGCALAGVDRTILLCDTASQIQTGRYSLSNLLDSNAVGGTWVDVSGSGALNGNLIVLNQLLADTLYRYQYQIPASVGCAADTMEVRLQLVASACLISLAEQINQSAIQVFPNPNKGIFNVEFGQAVHNPVFTLHQLSGKSLAVQAVKLSENAYQLSTKNIPAGVYFISIQGDKKEILARKKVVIGE